MRAGRTVHGNHLFETCLSTDRQNERKGDPRCFFFGWRPKQFVRYWTRECVLAAAGGSGGQFLLGASLAASLAGVVSPIDQHRDDVVLSSKSGRHFTHGKDHLLNQSSSSVLRTCTSLSLFGIPSPSYTATRLGHAPDVLLSSLLLIPNWSATASFVCFARPLLRALSFSLKCSLSLSLCLCLPSLPSTRQNQASK